MDDIFLTVLSLSVSGGILALVLLLLKKFLFPLLSKSWQYYIWVLLIIRLILPFSPETSLMNRVFENASAVPTKIEATFPDIAQDYGIVSNDGLFLPEIGEDIPAAGEIETNPNIVSITKSIWHYCKIGAHYLWIVWISVALILFGKRLFLYLRALRNVKRHRRLIADETVLSLYREICTSRKVKRPPPLYSCSYLLSPMTMGFFRQFIVLPDSILKGEKRLPLVFQHEITHYRRRDVYYKWLMQTTLCLHWFNPLIYFAAKSMDEACELSCDDRVLRHLNQDEKHEYGFTLISCLKAGVHSKNSAVEITLCKDAREVKNRLVAIRHFRPESGKMVAAGIILAIFLTAGAGYLGAYTIKPTAAKNTGNAADALEFNGLDFISTNSFDREMLMSPNAMNLLQDAVFPADGIDSLRFNLKYCDTYFYYTDRDEFQVKQFADPSMPMSAKMSCYQEGNVMVTLAGQQFSYDINVIPKETFVSTLNPNSRMRVEIYIPASYRGSFSMELYSSYFRSYQPMSLSELNLSLNSSTCLISELHTEKFHINNSAGDLKISSMTAAGDISNTSGKITIDQFRLNGNFQVATVFGKIKLEMAKGQSYLFEGRNCMNPSTYFETQNKDGMRRAVIGDNPEHTLSIDAGGGTFVINESA